MSSSTAAAKADVDAPSHQDQASSETPLPKPYSPFWNPNLPWLDLFLGWMVSLFMPLSKMAEHSPDSEQARNVTNDTRTKFNKHMEGPFKQGCRKWSKACSNGGLAQCTWKVPRRPELLYEWNIIDKNDELMKQQVKKEQDENDKFVTVHLWFPVSLVTKEDGRKENDCGCVDVANFDLKSIDKDVPVVIWFHGGGLVLGTCDDAGWESKVSPLLNKQKHTTGSESVPPLVLLSVDYRLAPDYPLPAASIDALSVVDYCLEDDPERTIHISGESAGAYLSLVSAFAAHKQYPGRVQSALVMIPFLSPAADSMSVYMNSRSSPLVSIKWLRWCWRAALEMDDELVVDDMDETDVLAIGSNRTAWNKSKWKQNEEWHKFLEPMVGIPSGLIDKKATKFIVAVNKADPLYDDGKELARKLKKQGADVDYVEAKGSHAIGFMIDRKAMTELIEAWRIAIFEK